MRALVLNADFTPLSVITGLKDIMLKTQEHKLKRMNILEYYEREIWADGRSFLVPAVFHRFSAYVGLSPKSTPSKGSVLKRDSFMCQYCELPLSGKGATIDHVKPVSHFSKKSYANTWDNMVACCHQCNKIKRDRTPEQAGMKLKRHPVQPHTVITVDKQNAPAEWKKYL